MCITALLPSSLKLNASPSSKSKLRWWHARGCARFVVLRLGNHTVKRHTLPEHHLKVFCTALFSSVWSSKAPFTYKPTNPSLQQSRYTTVARPDPCSTPVSSPWLPLLAYAFQPPAQSLLSPTLPLKPEMVQPAGAVLSAAVCQSTSLPHTARQQRPTGWMVQAST